MNKDNLFEHFQGVIIKWNVIDVLSIDPFAGVKTDLILDMECFFIELKKLMDQSIFVSNTKNMKK